MKTSSRSRSMARLGCALWLALGVAVASDVRSPAGTGAGNLWYDSSSLGWGVQLTPRAAGMFGTLYVYDDAGSASWYAAGLDRESNADVWSGDLYAISGPWLGAPPADLAPLGLRKVGTMRWQRGAPDSASDILYFSADGNEVTENVARQTATILDDYSGRYAAATSTQSSCTGPREDVVELSITQGDPTLTIDWASAATGIACRFAGKLTQGPELGEVAATYACGTETGDARIYAMRQSAEMLTARWLATPRDGGCSTEGYLTAVRRR